MDGDEWKTGGCGRSPTPADIRLYVRDKQRVLAYLPGNDFPAEITFQSFACNGTFVKVHSNCFLAGMPVWMRAEQVQIVALLPDGEGSRGPCFLDLDGMI
jgi:hypothetical protein